MVSAVRPNINALNDSFFNPPTPVVKGIEAIDANEITILATKITAKIMNQLLIGIIFAPMEEYPFPLYANHFDPKSTIFELLLPTVTQRIETAFSKPLSFRAEGMPLDLFTENSSGILDQAQTADGNLERILRSIRRKLIDEAKMSSLSATLSANSAPSKELFFEIEIFICRKTVLAYAYGETIVDERAEWTREQGTIRQFELDVKNFRV